jgi:hypothetical protein
MPDSDGTDSPIMDHQPTLRERFQGCLLGLAVGDGLGARFEGQAAEHIRARYPTVDALISNPPNNELCGAGKRSQGSLRRRPSSHRRQVVGFLRSGS